MKYNACVSISHKNVLWALKNIGWNLQAHMTIVVVYCQTRMHRMLLLNLAVHTLTSRVWILYKLPVGHAVVRLVAALLYKPECRGFHSLSAALWSWGRLSLQQKWVPNVFPGGVKAAGGYVWQPYNFHMLIAMKFVSLKIVVPSGPVKACNKDCFTFEISLLLWQRCISVFTWERQSHSYLYIQYSNTEMCKRKTNLSKETGFDVLLWRVPNHVAVEMEWVTFAE